MRKWLLRVLAIAACLVLGAFGIAAWLLRGSLPAIDGTIATAGVEAPATIARDAAGVPVITASSRPDLAFATGFAHAQDRYFQMDLVRRQAAGELSALFGRVALDADRHYRFHRFRSVARGVLEELPDEHRRLLDRYAEGVNAGLASLDARPFEYFVLGKRPAAWTAEDSLLVVYAMFLQLNDSRARHDLRHGLAHRALPGEVYAWLFPDGSPWDAPLSGDVREPRPVPPPGLLSLRDAAASRAAFAPAEPAPPVLGSNNWAVGGALTRSGRAMLANDMHLGLGVPNIWYRARLVQAGPDGRDVTGVTLPGVPLLVAGSNGHVAWGYTNSYGDWTDAVVVLPGATRGTYRTAAGDRPFVLHRETIEVAGEGDVEYTVRETIWGPIDETLDYPDGEIAVSWTAHHARAVNMNLLELETARSVDAALDIANTVGIPPQNFVTGDAAGNIGWTIAGQIPVRRGYDPGRPADWSAVPGWTGWLDPKSFPRIVNPPEARLWTANARVVDGEALEAIGDGGYDLGARAKQIRDGLRAQQSFTEEDMLALQTDDRALFLSPWRDLLLDLLDSPGAADPALIEYRDLARNWTARAAPDSVGYRLVRAFRLEVRARVFEGLMAPVRAEYETLPAWTIDAQFEAPLWQLVTQRPPHLLPAGYDSWEALLLAAVRANIEDWEEEYGTALEQRTWGEMNTLLMRHPLSSSLPFVGSWLDMPAAAMAGDANMPRAQGADWGASQRIVVSPGDEANGLMHMPGGQSGHPLSDFYRAGHDDWLDGEPAPFLPGPARHTLKLAPGTG